MRSSLLLFAFTLIFSSFNVHPIEITEDMTGSWFNRDQEGHGFNIEVIGPNKSVFYWYVYNPDGTPTWLVGRGSHVEGKIEGVAYHNTGMRWGVFDPLERSQERWGTVNIQFWDCNTATVSYQSDDMSEQTIPYGFGEVQIVRLTAIHDSKCNETPYSGIYKGTFWSETQDEGYSATAILEGQSGRFAGFATDHQSFWGEYTVSGKDFSGLGAVYANDTGQVELNSSYFMEGRIIENYRLFTEYSIGGIPEGFADLYPVPQLYNRGMTIEGLVGNYEVEDQHTFNEGIATIAVDGVITGTDAAGCDWNGQITIPDERFNMFDIDLNVTGCGEQNGFYQGKGFQDDADDLEDGKAVWIFSFSGEWSLAVNMIRLP